MFFAAASLATVSLYIPTSYTVYVSAASSPSVDSIKVAIVEAQTATVNDEAAPPTEQSIQAEIELAIKPETESLPQVKEKEEESDKEESTTPRTVPFYSQFADISAPEWRKIGCGITSLAMLIDFYKPAITVDTLLSEGIKSGAYVSDAGWSHAGLIALARDHGLTGEAKYLTDKSMADAFDNLKTAVTEGPVMVSVHYTFEPTNPIPHLVVVTDIDSESVHYNDPAEKSGGGAISIQKFQNSWKKRYIEIRPTS